MQKIILQNKEKHNIPGKYKAIVVDDERLARKELISLLKIYDNIEIAGEAQDVKSAEELIGKISPDIIFLDIQMPGESGFSLIDKIETEAKIVFVTAFDEFAIRAFEVNALDYLMKPVNPARLKTTIERIESGREELKPQQNPLNYSDTLFLSVNSKTRFIKISSILVIKACGDYTEIITAEGKKGLTSKSMRDWESRLPEKHFARIHRNAIINLDYVDKSDEWFNYSYHIYLKGITEPLIMSRRYANKIKKKFL